jgi:DNA-binding NtrC family response regulator
MQMNTNFPHDAPRDLSGNQCPVDLSIALISPDEKRRAAAAESASNFCEFTSYLANPADLARLSQMQYDVIMVDIDGDTEAALKLVEKFSSGGKSWVLVYSSESSPEKLARCMRAGARDFLAFPFQPAVVNETLKRSLLPRPTTCVHRDPGQPRKVSVNHEAMWRHIFNEAPMVRSRVRS